MILYVYEVFVGDDQVEFIIFMVGFLIGLSMFGIFNYIFWVFQFVYDLGDEGEDFGFGNMLLFKGRFMKMVGEGEGKGEVSGGKFIKGGKEEFKKEEFIQFVKCEYLFIFLNDDG